MKKQTTLAFENNQTEENTVEIIPSSDGSDLKLTIVEKGKGNKKRKEATLYLSGSDLTEFIDELGNVRSVIEGQKNSSVSAQINS